MKKNGNIIIISILVAIILICCLSGIFINKTNNNQQQIVNSQIDKDKNENGINKYNIIQNVDGLEFSNVEINMKTDIECELTAEVLNTTNEIEEAHIIRIKVMDDKKELIEIFAGNISSIPAGEKGMLRAMVRKDLTFATNVEFQVIE